MAAKKKTVQKKVAVAAVVMKTPSNKKPVEKASLSDLVVAIDRLNVFLDAAIKAYDRNTAQMERVERALNDEVNIGVPMKVEATLATGRAIVKELVEPDEKEEEEVEHTPSYNIVIKKMKEAATQDAIDILRGQVDLSKKLTSAEQIVLRTKLAVRKQELPF